MNRIRTGDDLTDAATALADTWASAETAVRAAYPVAEAERVIIEAELIAARRRLADAQRWRVAIRDGHLDQDAHRIIRER